MRHMNNLEICNLVLDLDSEGDTKKYLAEILDSGLISDPIFNYVYIDSEEYYLDKNEILTELISLGINIPTREQALIRVLSEYLSGIVGGVFKPYETYRKIWLKLDFVESIDLGVDLSGIPYLVSEYEDFMEVGNVNFYGESECKRIRDESERKMVVLSEELLEKLNDQWDQSRMASVNGTPT